ncbi:hypothetical protein LEP1GSC176_0211 [Leptospira kirschneri str. MMD1493]|nr:hypothetical protein LEP1GSC176_0211 [Leptospira kirschneri str. MMD1493]
METVLTLTLLIVLPFLSRIDFASKFVKREIHMKTNDTPFIKSDLFWLKIFDFTILDFLIVRNLNWKNF